MKIQIIPETDIEKQKIQTIEHSGIKEFMLFGKKVDSDGMAVDVHEWTCSYRYLIGSMEFFVEVLHDERRERNDLAKQQEVIKEITGPQNAAPELKVLKVDGAEADVPQPSAEDFSPSK